MNVTGATEEKRLYSLEEAARLLGGISHWTLRKHADLGTIRVTRIGRLVRISSEELSRIEREGLPPLRKTGDDHAGCR